MKRLAFLLLLFPLTSHAHCPNAFDLSRQTYCAEIQWIEGDYKIQGVLTPSGQMSPYLNPQGEIPNRWILSKALIKIWLEDDPTHESLNLQGFRIFPYMHMQNGHHHSTSSQFEWNSQMELYEFSAASFQEMSGCWTFRWTLTPTHDLSKSEFLIDIVNYTNLNQDENSLMATYCSKNNPNTSSTEAHHH